MKPKWTYLLVSLLFLGIGCDQRDSDNSFYKVTGRTMGTTYSITMQGENPHLIQNSVDSILYEINRAVSTYDSTSMISLFNQKYTRYLDELPHRSTQNQMFVEIFRLSKQIFTTTQGAFDPTVMPLVNYWGFGYTDKADFSEQDSMTIPLLLSKVGLDHLEEEDGKLSSQVDSVKLDFSAIAKGYAVDEVSRFLSSKGIVNHYVEIGGEVYARGLNANKKVWRTGINVPSPKSDVDAIQEIIKVKNKGIATSGNYRNFFVEDGIIYSHTINPITGYPERNDLLSATIVADQCAVADAYATACMVMGFEKAKLLIENLDGIEGILIYSDLEGNMLTFDSTKK